MRIDPEKNSFKSRIQRAKEENEELQGLKRETNFEKSDFLALIIAAATTILPLVLGLIFLYYFITSYFFKF